MTSNLPVTSITTSKSLATSNLTPEQKELCDTTCAEIRVIETSLMKTIFYIGKRLIKVKDQLDHGQFSSWIASDVGYSQRTAQNYMNAFRCLGDKSETVSLLPIKTIYDIASLPNEQREDIVALITDPTNPPVKEIKRKVAIQKASNKPDPQQVLEDKKKVAKEKARAKMLAKATPAAQEAAKKRDASAAKKEAAAILAKEQHRQTVADQSAAWVIKLDNAILREISAAISNVGQYEVMRAIKASIDALLNGTKNAGTNVPELPKMPMLDLSENTLPEIDAITELQLTAA
jgi:hypothetical protein